MSVCLSLSFSFSHPNKPSLTSDLIITFLLAFVLCLCFSFLFYVWGNHVLDIEGEYVMGFCDLIVICSNFFILISTLLDNAW